MNFRLVTKILGYILLVEAGCLLLPMAISLGYGEPTWRSFAMIALVCAVPGFCLSRLGTGKRDQMQGRDGYMAVAVAWLGLSAFGALPYVVSGAITMWTPCLRPCPASPPPVRQFSPRWSICPGACCSGGQRPSGWAAWACW